MLVFKSSSLIFCYSKELIFRFSYVFLSFFLCILVSVLNIESILFFETYPFLKFSYKKFIVTNTTDLFNIIWTLVVSKSLISVYPFIFYQIYLFSKSSWYNYQIYLFKKLILFSFCFYCVSLFICYIIILPHIIDFLIQWELKDKYAILSIEVEFRILNYIYWILSFSYFFSLINYYFSIFIVKLLFLMSIWNLFNFIKVYRKQISFFSIFFLFLSSPSDYLLQFFIILLILLFYEVFFFFLCYKIKNSDI